MIPEDERALLLGLAQRIEHVVLLQGVHVLQEEGVEMAWRHGAGDFGPFYQDDVAAVGLFLSVLAGQVEVTLLHAFAGGLPLYMVGQGDGIQALFPRLAHPQRRPHDTVGEDGVDMQVALQQVVTGHLREADFLAHFHSLLPHLHAVGQVLALLGGHASPAGRGSKQRRCQDDAFASHSYLRV